MKKLIIFLILISIPVSISSQDINYDYTVKMNQAAKDFLEVLSDIYYTKVDSLKNELEKIKQEKNYDSKRMR